MPLTVFAGTSKDLYAGAPEQAAQSFLKQHAGLFGMQADLSDLELDRTDTRDEVTHVRFRQTYEGIPVWEGDYLVHLRPDGRVVMANGHYYPSIEAPSSPGITEATARKTALDDLGGNVPLRGEIETELVVYPTERKNKFLLAWRVLVPANAPVGGDWQYFVDAISGTVVDKIDLMSSVVGDGDIIEDHPGLTPNPVIKDFYRLDGSGFLQGDYAQVFNDEDNRAFSSGNSFQYNLNDTHFDEANVYWHLDTYRANFLETNLTFFGNFGSDGDEDIVAVVNDVTVRPDRAGYSPETQQIRFGNNYEFAKEDKIIYHEFTHGVAHVEHGSLEPTADEQGAISEGNADYFAGAFTGRTLILDSLPFEDRDMANPGIGHYDDLSRDPNTGEVNEPPHDGGEFWSAVLWDLRII